MPTNTYSPISSQTLTGNASTITINSFSGYTDLRVVISFFTSSGVQETVQLNGSGGAAYEQMILNSFGSTMPLSGGYKVYNYSGRSDFYLYGGWTQNGTTIPAVIDLYFPYYANTSAYHYVFGSYYSGQAQTGSTYNKDLWQGQWKSGAAITSMVFNGAFAAGTVVQVFGITEA